MWNMAGDAGLARAIVSTKMNGENVDFSALLNSLHNTFGQECMPLMLPIGHGNGFTGVVDLLGISKEVPCEEAGDVEVSRKELIEAIASVDDESLENYLDGQEIETLKLHECFRKAIINRTVVLVLCCAGKKELGKEQQEIEGAIPGDIITISKEKGIIETLEKGILSHNQIVDVRAVLYDGSFHNVDSSEAAFKIAASKAFQKAFQNAKPVLLEPVVTLEVTIPSEFMGDIIGNISSRRGHIEGMESHGDLQMVKTSISLAEVANYETELKSMTHGRGSYSMEFSHYDIVPSHLAGAIIAQSKKESVSEN